MHATVSTHRHDARRPNMVPSPLGSVQHERSATERKMRLICGGSMRSVPAEAPRYCRPVVTEFTAVRVAVAAGVHRNGGMRQITGRQRRCCVMPAPCRRGVPGVLFPTVAAATTPLSPRSAPSASAVLNVLDRYCRGLKRVLVLNNAWGNTAPWLRGRIPSDSGTCGSQLTRVSPERVCG